MELLKERIRKDGIIIEDRILKVDNFLNHQLDVELFSEMGKEWKRRFKDKNINKIVTVESSGIAIACIAAQHFGNIPVVFAKKQKPNSMDGELFEARVYSFTKEQECYIKISKNYLNEDDCVLIIDDFLASGSAVAGMIDICKQANCTIAGVGIVIEKKFQGGRELVLSQGIQLESLAILEGLKNGEVIFSK